MGALYMAIPAEGVDVCGALGISPWSPLIAGNPRMRMVVSNVLQTAVFYPLVAVVGKIGQMLAESANRAEPLLQCTRMTRFEIKTTTFLRQMTQIS